MPKNVRQWYGLSGYTANQGSSSHHPNNLVRLVGKLLPDAYDPEVMPEVGELDELQTYVKKTQNLAVDSR
jgi:hypothetical protein